MKTSGLLVALVLSVSSLPVYSQGVGGNIGVSLTIYPASGCANQMCAIETSKVIKDIAIHKVDAGYKASVKDTLLTIEF